MTPLVYAELLTMPALSSGGCTLSSVKLPPPLLAPQRLLLEAATAWLAPTTDALHAKKSHAADTRGQPFTRSHVVLCVARQYWMWVCVGSRRVSSSVLQFVAAWYLAKGGDNVACDVLLIAPLWVWKWHTVCPSKGALPWKHSPWMDGTCR